MTWGESHGKAIGCVVDGVPPGILLQELDIQCYLDKRKPGQSKYTTQRKESDTVEILSGTFEGKATGHPISLIIYNEDMRSRDYSKIKDKFRPGHADFTYFAKYDGIRDYRGGGRSSARETAMKVAAGAIARKILGDIKIQGALIQVGEHKINRDRFNWDEVENNLFWCPDKDMVDVWADYIDSVRKNLDSVGAIIEVHAKNVPLGLGEPIYSKLSANLAKAIMGINAVKGVEIGTGFAACRMHGSQHSDQMCNEDGKVKFVSNHAGGILGGISNGDDIVVRFVVKPTSSIAQPLKTLDMDLNNVEIQTTGRHDPCVGIRAVPIGEAMVACVLADHILMRRAMAGFSER